jgi:hypothetical protein
VVRSSKRALAARSASTCRCSPVTSSKRVPIAPIWERQSAFNEAPLRRAYQYSSTSFRLFALTGSRQKLVVGLG